MREIVLSHLTLGVIGVVVIAVIVFVIWLIQGLYFNILISPEKQLEHYLSSKYKGVEFSYKSNNEELVGLGNSLYSDHNMRWSFEVYPKENEELKFEVTSFYRMEKTSYETGAERSFFIFNTDDFDSAVIESVEKDLMPLDISDSKNDSKNAEIIYNALKKAEELNEKYNVKYKISHYLNVEVFIGDKHEKFYHAEVNGIYTMESIIANIERIRDNM